MDRLEWSIRCLHRVDPGNRFPVIGAGNASTFVTKNMSKVEIRNETDSPMLLQHLFMRARAPRLFAANAMVQRRYHWAFHAFLTGGEHPPPRGAPFFFFLYFLLSSPPP